MKYLVTCAAAAALGLVAITPGSAEAGWRSGWWGGPGVGIYVGPRYGYGYRNYSYRYRPYYYDRYAYGYGPRWKYRLPLLRLGKKGLAPRANLAGVEQSGRTARAIHCFVVRIPATNHWGRPRAGPFGFASVRIRYAGGNREGV